MQRLGADRGDESLDGAIIDAGRLNAAFTGVAGQARQAEMGTSGRKLLKQGLPLGLKGTRAERRAEWRPLAFTAARKSDRRM